MKTKLRFIVICSVLCASCLSNYAQAPAASGTIITIAGNGMNPAPSGDGGPATNAALTGPVGLATGRDGTVYFYDLHDAITTGGFRAINPSNGIINTIVASVSSEGLGLGVDSIRHKLYFSDFDDDVILQINLSNNAVTPFAGAGWSYPYPIDGSGYRGDGGPASEAWFSLSPYAVATDGAGNVFIAEGARLRKVNASTHIITTICGLPDPMVSGLSDIAASTGDGGPSTNAALTFPARLTVDRTGDVFVLDIQGSSSSGCHVRRIDAATGIINTIAGTGTNSPATTGPAVNMGLTNLQAIAVNDAGTELFLGEITRVYRIDLTTGILSPYAGNGTNGFAGDGGPALNAEFNEFGVHCLAEPPGGGLLISDYGNQRVRYVVPDSITLTNDPGQREFYLPWIKSLTGNLTIVNNTNATVIGMGSMTDVAGSVDVSSNSAATVINLGSVSSVAGSVNLNDNVVVGSVDLSSVTNIGGAVNIGGNSAAGSVNLGSLQSAGSVDLSSNSAATVINLGSLSSVAGSVNLNDNAAVGSVNLSSVTNVGGAVNIGGNSAAGSVNLGSLQSAGSVDIRSNSAATVINLGSLSSVAGSVDLSDNTGATNMNISSLRRAGSHLFITNNPAVKVIDASSITNVGGDLDISGNTSATVIDAGALAGVGGDLDISGNTSADAINAGSLITVDGDLDINGNTSATVIDVGALAGVGGELDISGNTNAGLLDLGSLQNVGGDLDISGNTSANVINAGALTTVDGNLDISGNTDADVINVSSLTAVDGNLTIASNAPDAAVNANGLTNYDGGMLTLDGDVSVTNGLTLETNATLAGSATLDGSVTNNGTISPGASPGHLSFKRNLVLNAGSRLQMELGGYASNQFDSISVAGATALGGTLSVSLINNFQGGLTNGASFTLLTGGNPLTGAFANVASGGSLTTTDGRARFTVLYAGQTSVRLTDLVTLNPDSDGDGVSDADELLAGTDPNNPASVFRIVSLQPEAGGVRLTWSTVGGKSYVVQTNGSLTAPFADFSPLITAPGTGEAMTNIVTSTTAPSLYYRIRLGP